MVSRLSVVGRLVLALLAVFAFGVMVASAAQAANEPLQWKYEGKVLKANETREITAKIPAGVLELEGTTAKKLKVSCSEGKLAKGAFIANQNEVATTESVAEFSKCTVAGNGEKCTKVEEPIRTKSPVRAEPVLNDLEPGEGTKVLWEFDPRTGKEFAELKFEPLAGNEGCKFKNTQVTGLVLAKALTDKTITTEKELEYSETREETSYILKWPDEPKSVYLWESTAYKLFEPTQLTAFSEKAGLRGELLILAATSGAKFGLAPR